MINEALFLGLQPATTPATFFAAVSPSNAAKAKFWAETCQSTYAPLCYFYIYLGVQYILC